MTNRRKRHRRIPQGRVHAWIAAAALAVTAAFAVLLFLPWYTAFFWHSPPEIVEWLIQRTAWWLLGAFSVLAVAAISESVWHLRLRAAERSR